MDVLPDSVRAACWLTAWLDGRASADATIEALSAHAPVVVWDDERLTPAWLLARLRSSGATSAVAALPAPGDPTGLAGPPATNAAVVDAGEGVHLLGADRVLVPGHDAWEARDAVRPELPHWREVDRLLRSVLISTADALAALDVARWNPDVADALMNLRAPADEPDDLPLPTPEVASLLSQAARCRTIVALARADDGAAVSATEASLRTRALDELEQVSRLALVAATAAPVAAG